MSNTQQNRNGSLNDSIVMLEQILEVMPQDVDALKALYNAYVSNGDLDHAFKHLSSLVDVALGSADISVAEFVQRQLARFDEIYPSEVVAQYARLRVLQQTDESPSSTAALPDTGDTGKKEEVDISEELALAWRLYEENQLSQEEYSSVLHDLTEVSSKELDVPISVMHVLNDRGFTQMNRIMTHLTSRSGVPFITLENFELTENMVGALPIDYSAKDGALPFGFFGNDLLVGVLNPFNNMLVDRIENESGHRCHTYLVESRDYDLALGKLRSLTQKA